MNEFLGLDGKVAVVTGGASGLGEAVARGLVREGARVVLGDVDTVGIGAQVIYVKGVLDKFKVKADFLHMGKYKSAAESVTQEGPSEAAREALTSVLGSIRETWLETSEKSRAGKNLAEVMEDGPWDAEEAKKRGLIDEIGYEDDAKRDYEAREHWQSYLLLEPHGPWAEHARSCLDRPLDV